MANSEVALRAGPCGRQDPIDVAHLQRATLEDTALEREVLDLFLRQSGLLAAHMLEGAGGDRWREAAHTLKGSALGVGAFPLAALAAAAELTGPLPARLRLLADLQAELGRVQEAIAARMGRL